MRSELSSGFKLVIQVPKQSTQEVLIESKLLIGESEACDLCFEGVGLHSKHALFSIQKNVLMIQNLGPKGSVKIGWHKCEQGKTYILDHKDKLSLGKIAIQVFEVDPEEFLNQEIDEDDEDEQDEVTDQAENEDELEEEDELTPEEEEEETPPEVTSIEIGSLLRSGGAQHHQTESKNHSSTESRFSLTRTLSKIFKRPKKPALEEEKKVKRGSTPAPQLKPSKVKSKSVTSRLMPGVIVRLMAFILQATMCWLISRYILESQQFNQQIETYYPQLIELIQQFILLPLNLTLELEGSLTPMMALWALSYFVLDFTSALILGVNLGLWLFGVRETSGYVRSRLKAMIRHPLGWLTAPLIIFDIGVLAKFRTFKEYLTRSQLEKVSPLTTFLNVIFVIPVITILILLDPLIFQEEPKVTISSPTLKMNDQELKPLKYFRLSSYQLDIPWSQEIDNLSLLIPHPQSGMFGLEKWVDYSGPKLSIFSGQEFDVRQWFADYKKSNPISFYFQPVLTEFFRGSQGQVITEEIKLEIKKSIEFAHLSNYTDVQTLIDGITQFGPLVSRVLKIRESLREQLQLQDESTLEFWDFKNKTWIVTHHKLENGYRFQIYPLDRVPNQSFIVETDTMSFQEFYQYASTEMIDYMPFRSSKPKPIEKERSPSDLWAIIPFVDLLNQRHRSDSDFNFSEEYLDSVIESLSFRFRQYLLNPNPQNNQQRELFSPRMEQVHSILRKDLETYNPKFRSFADKFLKLYQDFKMKDLSDYPTIPTFRTIDDNSTRE